jgi:RNA polymerase sigma factor (sigma-70 family)
VESASERLYQQIFRYPLLSVKDLRTLFQQFEDIIFGIRDLLLEHTILVEYYIADTIAEIGAGITRGRTLFIKPKKVDTEEVTEETLDSVEESAIFEESHVEALEIGIQLLNALASGKPDPKQTMRWLEELKFIRAIYEGLFELFIDITAKYQKHSLAFVKIEQQLYEVEDPEELLADYNYINDSMSTIEQAVFCDRYMLYHLCQEAQHSLDDLKVVRSNVMEPYLRLVFKHARHHAANEQQLLDNFQDGITGLMRAVSYFDFHNYPNFSPYAQWWINQSILLMLKQQANFIRLPIGVWQNYNWLENVKAKITAKRGECTMGDLANETGFSHDQLHAIYEGVGISNVSSLDYFVDPDEKVPLSSLVADNSIVPPDELALPIINYLRFLTEEERKIICLHYGLVDHIPQNNLTAADIQLEKLRQRW